jgi:hypothetical protein
MKINGHTISVEAFLTILANAILVGIAWGLLTAGQAAIQRDVDRLYQKTEHIEQRLEGLNGRTP